MINDTKIINAYTKRRLPAINPYWSCAMSFFDNCNGKRSMMRLGFMISMVVGSVVSLTGCIAMFMSLPDAGMAITIGTGLIGSSAFAKAVQSKYESSK